MIKSRLIILLTFLLTWNIDANSQSDGEIIKQVLFDFVLTDRQLKSGDIPPTTIVVLDQPSHKINFDSTNYLRFERDYKKLEWDTFNDFIENNNSAFGLDTPDIKNLKIIMFKREDFKGWDSFIKSFPDYSIGLLEFSNVGFNGTKTQAIIYYGYRSAPLVGGGVYVIYERKKTKWKIRKKIGAWAS